MTQGLDLDLDLAGGPLDGLRAVTIPLTEPDSSELGAAAVSACTSIANGDRATSSVPTLVQQGMMFDSNERLVVGLGAAARLRLEGGTADTESVRAVTRRLAEIPCDDPVGRPGSSVVALGALPFDPTSPGELVIPEVTFVAEKDGSSWITVVGRRTLDLPDLRERSRGPMRDIGEAGETGAVVVESGDVAFVDAVQKALRHIEAGRLQKVVLARKVIVDFGTPVDVDATVSALRRREQSATIFAVTSPGCAFVGASPELLVAREGGLVSSVPLAGTVRMTGDRASDEAAVAHLVASTKENLEHRLVVDAVAARVGLFCVELQLPTDPEVLWLRQIAHLATPIAGRLGCSPAGWPSALELAADLHPTPAVGGSPGPAGSSSSPSSSPMDEVFTPGRSVGWMQRETATSSSASGPPRWQRPRPRSMRERGSSRVPTLQTSSPRPPSSWTRCSGHCGPPDPLRSFAGRRTLFHEPRTQGGPAHGQREDTGCVAGEEMARAGDEPELRAGNRGRRARCDQWRDDDVPGPGHHLDRQPERGYGRLHVPDLSEERSLLCDDRAPHSAPAGSDSCKLRVGKVRCHPAAYAPRRQTPRRPKERKDCSRSAESSGDQHLSDEGGGEQPIDGAQMLSGAHRSCQDQSGDEVRASRGKQDRDAASVAVTDDYHLPEALLCDHGREEVDVLVHRSRRSPAVSVAWPVGSDHPVRGIEQFGNRFEIAPRSRLAMDEDDRHGVTPSGRRVTGRRGAPHALLLELVAALGARCRRAGRRSSSSPESVGSSK